MRYVDASLDPGTEAARAKEGKRLARACKHLERLILRQEFARAYADRPQHFKLDHYRHGFRALNWRSHHADILAEFFAWGCTTWRIAAVKEQLCERDKLRQMKNRRLRGY